MNIKRMYLTNHLDLYKSWKNLVTARNIYLYTCRFLDNSKHDRMIADPNNVEWVMKHHINTRSQSTLYRWQKEVQLQETWVRSFLSWRRVSRHENHHSKNMPHVMQTTEQHPVTGDTCDGLMKEPLCYRCWMYIMKNHLVTSLYYAEIGK